VLALERNFEAKEHNSSPIEWHHPTRARQKFCAPHFYEQLSEIEVRINEARAAVNERTREASEQYSREGRRITTGQSSENMFMDKRVEAVSRMASLIGERATINQEMALNLVAQLHSGILVAEGFAPPDMSRPKQIPREQWRILKLDVDSATAKGTHLSY